VSGGDAKIDRLFFLKFVKMGEIYLIKIYQMLFMDKAVLNIGYVEVDKMIAMLLRISPSKRGDRHVRKYLRSQNYKARKNKQTIHRSVEEPKLQRELDQGVFSGKDNQFQFWSLGWRKGQFRKSTSPKNTGRHQTVHGVCGTNVNVGCW
jgi:hypothetical protein